MKKKIAILTVVLALIVVFAVVLTSCGIADKVSSLIPSGGDGGEGGDGQGGENSLPQIVELSSKLEELKVQGFMAAYTYSLNNELVWSVTVAAKGDLYYLKSNEGEMYWDCSSEASYDMYSYDAEERAWSKITIPYSEEYSKANIVGMLTTAMNSIATALGTDVYAGEYSKTSDRYLNRDCDKYVTHENDSNIYASGTYHYELYLDKALGIVLKATASLSAREGTQTYSASWEILCTQLNVNYTLTLPSVNGQEQQGQGGNGSQGQGGNGESGEGGGQVIGGEGEGEQDRGPFIDKRLAVTAVNIPDNRALEQYFEGGYVQLYSSMDFECISDFGCLLGHFVSYHNATSGTAYLNAIKIYADGKYDYESAESMAEMELVFADGEYTLTFELYVEDTLTEIELTLEDAGRIQAHDNDVCPLDPNGYGIDPAYQVTQAEWDGIFKGDWLFEEIGNFTVDWDVASETWPHSGTFKVDYDYINDDGMFIYSRETWEPDQDGLYEFHAYYYNSGAGEWSDQGSAYVDLVDQWDDYTGAIPADFMKAGYNSIGHYYYINSFSYIPSGYSSRVSVTDFRVWFSSNLITKIEYTRAGETLTFEFYDYNDTEVEVPND